MAPRSDGVGETRERIFRLQALGFLSPGHPIVRQDSPELCGEKEPCGSTVQSSLELRQRPRKVREVVGVQNLNARGVVAIERSGASGATSVRPIDGRVKPQS